MPYQVRVSSMTVSPALGIVEVVDEVPVRHHLADHLPREPQAGPGDAVVARELLAAGIQVLGLRNPPGAASGAPARRRRQLGRRRS